MGMRFCKGRIALLILFAWFAPVKSADRKAPARRGSSAHLTIRKTLLAATTQYVMHIDGQHLDLFRCQALAPRWHHAAVHAAV